MVMIPPHITYLMILFGLLWSQCTPLGGYSTRFLLYVGERIAILSI